MCWKYGAARRMDNARWCLSRGRFNDAREELEGVDGEEAAALRVIALEGLVRTVLTEATASLFTGESRRAEDLFATARKYGATPEQIDAARRADRPDKPRSPGKAA